MKGDVNTWFYVIAVILIFFIALLVAIKTVDIAKSPEVSAVKLSSQIPLYINALSTVEEGKVIITADGKYDIQIADKDSILRYILPDFIADKPGYYVVVTPYRITSVYEVGKQATTKTEKLDAEVGLILSYPTSEDSLPTKFSVDRGEGICIEKTSGEKYPKVKKC